MDIEKVKAVVDGIPCMEFQQAQEITRLISENNYTSILELGFHQGVSTCYMAGAIEELGGGSIISIDHISAKENKPGINKLLSELSLEKYVTCFYEPTSYVWRLMQMIEEDPTPRFDFCYIDGAHDWFNDGFSFFLVDKLLKPGGMIVFDDLDWTFSTSAALKNSERVKNMPADEREIPQIRKVYELLVKQHPSYEEFQIKDDWAIARKKLDTSKSTGKEVVTEIVYQKEQVGLGALILKLLRKLKK